MSSNTILDVNLQQISKYNPNLKYKILRKINSNNSISFVKTILQEDNLIYNNTCIHNNYGAEAEAKEIFENIQRNVSSILILYGMGLGYLFKEAVKRHSGTILLYEPNIDILYAALKNRDFTEELIRKNVFIFSDFNLLKNTYVQNFKYKSETKIAFLPSYNQLFKKDIIKFANDLNLVMSECIATNNFIKQKMFASIKSVCTNIDLLVKEPVLQEYKDTYKGKTAIVISSDKISGENIETIKKHRQNTIIFAVDKTLRTLLTSGIFPNFVGISAFNSQISQFEGLDLSEIEAIVEPLTDRNVHKLKFKNIISYPSQNSLPNIIWTSLSNINASPYYSTETASYTLMQTAQFLGFTDIIILGECFSQNILYFEDFAKKHNELNLFHTSPDNAKPEGFKYVQLENLIKSKGAIEKITLDHKNYIDVSNLILNINQEISNIDVILKFLKSAVALIANADKELLENNSLTKNFLNYFKQILTIYADLKEIYAAKNRLFLYLQQGYSLDLEDELNKSRQKDSIPKVYNLLKIYMSSLISDLTEIKEILKIKIGELNEMLNTKG